jgi:hypothetical protein
VDISTERAQFVGMQKDSSGAAELSAQIWAATWAMGLKDDMVAVDLEVRFDAAAAADPAQPAAESSAHHAALHEHTGGRSVDLDMMLENQGADPAYRATVDVVLHWKAALVDLWATRARLLRTMVRAIHNAAAAPCPFTVVMGPASAVVAAVSRFGWTFSSATTVTTHVGEISLDNVSMGELRTLCDEGFDLWRWRNVTSGKHTADLAEAPLLAPIVRAISRSYCPLATCAIKSVFSNGAWTQRGKYDQRYSPTDLCQACGEHSGTMWHRLYECTTLDTFRETHPHCANLNVQRWAAGGAPMWTRLLLADPTWGAPRPRLDDAIVWVLRPADGSLAQNGFGDGSVYNGSHKRLARGGGVSQPTTTMARSRRCSTARCQGTTKTYSWRSFSPCGCTSATLALSVGITVLTPCPW